MFNRIAISAAFNSNYNSSACHDGGSYFQPFGTAYFATRHFIVAVDVDDTSCGDFGTRIEVVARVSGETIMLHIGSMEADPDDYIDECLNRIADIIDDDPVALIRTAISAVREEARQAWRAS